MALESTLGLGTSTAPTQAASDNSTNLATTAYVDAAITAGAGPTGAAGGSLTGTYPNPAIASSVSLPGSPTTTTQSPFDSSTKIATTAYVDAAVTAGSGGGGGGGGATAPTVLQSAYLRGNSAGTIALGSTPTVGSVMLLIMSGAGGGTGLPTGWSLIAPITTTSFQKAFAAVKTVKTGETGSVAVTASDWHNLALFELDDVKYHAYKVNTLVTSGGTGTIPFLQTLIVGTPRLYIALEHDIGSTLAVTEPGFTTLQTYGASSNHWGVLASRSTDFAAEVSITSASTFNDPICIAVAVGK